MERINNSLINANIKLIDENKELKKEIERLNNVINELEDIIKEVREYITNNYNTELSVDSYYRYEDIVEFNDILKILDKGSDKE